LWEKWFHPASTDNPLYAERGANVKEIMLTTLLIKQKYSFPEKFY